MTQWATNYLKIAASKWRTGPVMQSMTGRLMEKKLYPNIPPGSLAPKLNPPTRGTAIHVLKDSFSPQPAGTGLVDRLRQLEAATVSRVAGAPVQPGLPPRPRSFPPESEHPRLGYRVSGTPQTGNQGKVVSYAASPLTQYLGESPSLKKQEQPLGGMARPEYQSGYQESAVMPKNTAWFNHMGLDHHPQRSTMNSELSAAASAVPVEKQHEVVQTEVRKRLTDLKDTPGPNAVIPPHEYKPGDDFYADMEAMAPRQKNKPDYYVNKASPRDAFHIPLDNADPHRLEAMHKSYSAPAWQAPAAKMGALGPGRLQRGLFGGLIASALTYSQTLPTIEHNHTGKRPALVAPPPLDHPRFKFPAVGVPALPGFSFNQ